jgi:hypothetical protein
MKDLKLYQDPQVFNRYVLEYDPSIMPQLVELFTYKYQAKDFDYRLKRTVTYWEEDYICEHEMLEDGSDWNDDNVMYIHKGFAPYLRNILDAFLDDNEKALLDHDIYAQNDWSETFDYTGLREDQEEIVMKMLLYRRCIIQIPTGFGKTEIIARMVLNAQKKGLKVLVTTGISKVIDEIKDRIWKYAPDMELPDYWDEESWINIIYPVGFCRSNIYDGESDWWKNVDLVISDEVSGACTDSAWGCMLPIKNPDCLWYGFDATAEKVKADRLDIRNNLTCIHTESTVYVIDFFGMAWLYDKPHGYDIDVIEVSNIGLREINEGLDEDLPSEQAQYLEIVNYIFSHTEYIRTVEYILQKYNRLFIPINNLSYIDMMTDHFCEKYHVITITSEGYWSSKEDFIDLARVKELCGENQVNLLMSSASGFKGLDFRGIPNVLLTVGVMASQVIQFVGRVARQKHFRILAITAGDNWKIPIYTNQNLKQLNLLTSYYSECNIRFSEDRFD